MSRRRSHDLDRILGTHRWGEELASAPAGAWSCQPPCGSSALTTVVPPGTDSNEQCNAGVARGLGRRHRCLQPAGDIARPLSMLTSRGRMSAKSLDKIVFVHGNDVACADDPTVAAEHRSDFGETRRYHDSDARLGRQGEDRTRSVFAAAAFEFERYDGYHRRNRTEPRIERARSD